MRVRVPSSPPLSGSRRRKRSAGGPARELNHAWFEFVDNRCYDFTMVRAPMREVCELDLSRYDVATAFCSLYYESADDMKRIVQSLSEAVEFFVVQCNENPNEHSGDLLERSSLPFLTRLLSENGFSSQEVASFGYYDRPLIVARSDHVA